jgi:hydrogenase nickel incorporation protein HypB
MDRAIGPQQIKVVTRILRANDQVANENRQRFAEAGVYVIDLIGSPGAGKTALLEATISRLAPEISAAVIVGDIATTSDAQRIAPLGVPVVQIITESFGGACHLEAHAVKEALNQLDLEALDLLFIENVGNLVCPAEFDLGQHARIPLLSLAEGEDKPIKYPLAFRTADLVILTKMDLCPHLPIDLDVLRKNLWQVNPHVGCIETSAQTGAGLEKWLDWIGRTLSRSQDQAATPSPTKGTTPVVAQHQEGSHSH